MNIYSQIQITEKIKNNFKPTRLYIKELHGLYYFGKSVRENILKYTGGGTRWSNQIKKYGKQNIKTIWISEYFYTPEDLQEFALFVSEEYDIVNNPNWGNLIPENGLTGMTGSKKGHMSGIPKPKSETHKKQISETLTGITLENRFGKEKADQIKSKMSIKAKGRKHSKEYCEQSSNRNKLLVENNQHPFQSEKNKKKTSIRNSISNKQKSSRKLYLEVKRLCEKTGYTKPQCLHTRSDIFLEKLKQELLQLN